jgi:hypothetical protein
MGPMLSAGINFINTFTCAFFMQKTKKASLLKTNFKMLFCMKTLLVSSSLSMVWVKKSLKLFWRTANCDL